MSFYQQNVSGFDRKYGCENKQNTEESPPIGLERLHAGEVVLRTSRSDID